MISAHVRLKVWLEANLVSVENIQTARVVFGPGARYMAWTRDGKWIGNDLPSGLASLLEKRLAMGSKGDAMPKLVAFGKGSSWVALWPDDSHSLHLEDNYTKLREYLSSNAGEKILVSNHFFRLLKSSFDNSANCSSTSLSAHSRTITTSDLKQ